MHPPVMSTHAAPSARKPQKPKISDSFLAQLRDDLVWRRIGSGIDRLARYRPELVALDPSQRNAAPLVGLLAQWVDIGFDRPQLVSDLRSRFPQVSRASLPLCDYLHLRMAEGFVAMSAEDCDNAIRHFEAVLSFETEIQDKEMLSIANFWIARCQRKIDRKSV